MGEGLDEGGIGETPVRLDDDAAVARGDQLQRVRERRGKSGAPVDFGEAQTAQDRRDTRQFATTHEQIDVAHRARRGVAVDALGQVEAPQRRAPHAGGFQGADESRQLGREHHRPGREVDAAALQPLAHVGRQRRPRRREAPEEPSRQAVGGRRARQAPPRLGPDGGHRLFRAQQLEQQGLDRHAERSRSTASRAPARRSKPRG